MSAFTKVSRVLAVTQGTHYAFFCPACQSPHVLPTGTHEQPRWAFDGKLEKPSFSPSILVKTGAAVDPAFVAEPGDPPTICHSFVIDGKVRYLDDCDHPLAGQVVDLVDWPEAH